MKNILKAQFFLAIGIILNNFLFSVVSFAQSNQKITFVSSRDGNKEIYIMNADGSHQKRLTFYSEEDDDPCWSPDGKQILYRSMRNDKWQIYIMNSDGSGQRAITDNALNNHNVVWSPDGSHILVSGTPSSSEFSAIHQIYLMDIKSTYNFQLTNYSYSAWPYSWTNDGKTILFSTGKGDVYAMNVDGSNQINLTNDPSQDSNPLYSPNGEKILFISDREGNDEIYIMNKDGSNQKQLTKSLGLVGFISWSPDGTKISFVAKINSKWEIFIMNKDGSDQHKVFENSEPNGPHTWSSDSKYIIYDSNRNGNNFDIYKVNIKDSAIYQLTKETGDNTLPVMQPVNKKPIKIKYDISKALTIKNENNEKTLNPNSAKLNDPSWDTGNPPNGCYWLCSRESGCNIGDSVQQVKYTGSRFREGGKRKFTKGTKVVIAMDFNFTKTIPLKESDGWIRKCK